MNHQAQLVLSYKGPEPDSELREWIVAGLVGGIVLFADNFISRSQLADSITRLKECCPQTLCVMIDEEGGPVRRLPESVSPMPAVSSYGKNANAAGAAGDYALVGRMLSDMGIDTLLAPVLDVRTAHNRWLAERVFSDNPWEVADFARHTVKAVRDAGLSACAKHFPGLGGVADDLHHRQFVVNDPGSVIEDRDLPPFHAAIDAGVEKIMISHAVYEHLDPGRPAVFSPLIIGELLTRRLGFAGEVLSDDLTMGAIKESMPIEKAIELSLVAGCDQVLVCNDRSLQRRAVQFLT
jgi:beta-N-acetylhexosaminidase